MAEYKKYSNTAEGHPMMEEKKEPFSGALANQKTNFRDQNILVTDTDPVNDPAVHPVFAYPGTDKGVAGQTD